MTYHAEVVGSLLRPTYLAETRKQYEAGELSAADFKVVEDQAVNESIALQESAGIDAITDGEMRRYAFYGHLVESLAGFDKYGGWAIPFRDESGEELVLKRPVVVEKLQWKRSMCSEEWVYLRSRASRPGKVTMLSAQQAAAYYDPEKSKSAYATRDAYLADIVDFSRREVAELVRLGCTYIQIDAPQYAALLDSKMREGYRQRGTDPDQIIDTCIEMDNAIIDGHPGITFGLHVCRGNNQSRFTPAAIMNPSPRYSTTPTSSVSCSNTMTRVRAASNPCGTCRTTASWCLGLSPPRSHAWRAPQKCAIVLKKRHAMFHWNVLPSALNAALPPRWRGITSRSKTSSISWNWWRASRARSGASSTRAFMRLQTGRTGMACLHL